jgi:hypothetical protein
MKWPASSAMMRASRGTVAQLVEQGPFKALVLGSSPSRPTYKSMSYRRTETHSTKKVPKLKPGVLSTAQGVTRGQVGTHGDRGTSSGCRRARNLSPAALDNATHIFWLTGGSLMPQEEFGALVERGGRVTNGGDA